MTSRFHPLQESEPNRYESTVEQIALGSSLAMGIRIAALVAISVGLIHGELLTGLIALLIIGILLGLFYGITLYRYLRENDSQEHS